MRVQDIIEGIKQKQKRALARAITLTENRDPLSFEVIDGIFNLTGNAHYVGVTGSPGAGKSTLINALIRSCRKLNKKVAVLAVDPSSPISGGAVLGDRIRLGDDILQDEQVFFRSIANRNHLGGLSESTFESLLLMDAFGFDIIFVETVGTGQSETLVSGLAHTNLVVVVPGFGDEVQAEKAGLLEIADIFVVNKSDLNGAENVKRDLEQMLQYRKKQEKTWDIPIVMTQANDNVGADTLVQYIEKHKEFQKQGSKADYYLPIIKDKTDLFVHKAIEQKIKQLLNESAGEIEKKLSQGISHIQIAKKFAESILKKI